jgi:aryl-alcohol dehydrogenase-like predicted oxidoreductase
MTDVVRAGKARYIGFSGWAPEQIRTAMALPGVEGFISSQPQYSLLHRGPEAEVIPLSAANGVSQIVWSPLAQGVLSGKYIPGAKLPAQSRNQSNHGPDDAILPTAANFGRGPTLEAPGGGGRLHDDSVCAGMGCFANPMSLRRSVGASRPAQLDDNAAASGLVIDPALFAKAEAIVAAIRMAPQG